MPIAAITGVHGYVPPDVLTNAQLAQMVDTTAEERAGIALTPGQIRLLKEIALAAEERRGHVVDIEGSIKDGRIDLLQIRPVPGFSVAEDRRAELAEVFKLVPKTEAEPSSRRRRQSPSGPPRAMIPNAGERASAALWSMVHNWQIFDVQVRSAFFAMSAQAVTLRLPGQIRTDIADAKQLGVRP